MRDISLYPVLAIISRACWSNFCGVFRGLDGTTCRPDRNGIPGYSRETVPIQLGYGRYRYWGQSVLSENRRVLHRIRHIYQYDQVHLVQSVQGKGNFLFRHNAVHKRGNIVTRLLCQRFEQRFLPPFYLILSRR